MQISFHLTEDQTQEITDWVKSRASDDVGAIGGQFTYTFTNTTIGQVCKVVDNLTGDELDVTDYDQF